MRLAPLFFCVALQGGILPAVQAADAQQRLPTRGESPVPEEVQQLFRDYSAALLSHNIERSMSYLSERYLHDGRDKAQRRTFTLEWINDLSRHEIKLLRFAAISDDLAYVEGLGDDNFVGFRIPFDFQVVKENGRWKLLGNQKRYDR